MSREDIDALADVLYVRIAQAMKQLICETLKEVGMKPRDIAPWVSQNKASKMVGRKRLERAMRDGVVEFRKINPGVKNSRVNVSMRDLIKLIKQPEL